jgi:signal peptidase I
MKNVGLLLAFFLSLFCFFLSSEILFACVAAMTLFVFVIQLFIKDGFLVKFKVFFKTSIVLSYFLLFVLVIENFVLDIYRVSSSSMEDTLFEGDVILVNKIMYGTKLQCLFIRKFERLPGFMKIRANDLIVLVNSLSDDNNTPVIKRCVGLPGDTVRIINECVKVNSNDIFNAKTVKENCDVYLYSSDDYEVFFDYKIFPNISRKSISEKRVNVNLTDEQIKMLKMSGKIKEIVYTNVTTDRYNYNKSQPWKLEKQEMGYILPCKGHSIAIDLNNIEFYRQILTNCEEVNVDQKEKFVLINGNFANQYKFQHDYYFYLGDNRAFSSDSRDWGIMPKKCIIGKAEIILFSNANNIGNYRRSKRNIMLEKIFNIKLIL